VIAFTLNGERRTFDGDPSTPLLWVLRDQLELTGTKYGCGQGLCGACTVHVGGDAARSCMTPMAALEGKSVTTIEGLAAGGREHPLQTAWKSHNVPQCGYCQSGQIMQAAALLARNNSPSEEQIDQNMSGNICRCGTYQRIKAAIREAGKELA
jgi:aerobic-type carbon monoxide dehydrogenase small subunit (CoxS/CutS family)